MSNLRHSAGRWSPICLARSTLKDIDGLLAYMTPEATQRIGNQETLRGHEQIREAHVAFYGTIDSLSHEVTGLWQWDGTVVVRSNATRRLDGVAVTVPAVTIFRESHGWIVG